LASIQINLLILIRRHRLFTRFVNFHVFLAKDVGLERLLAVGAHEVLVLRVAGHVAADGARSCEGGQTLAALVHLRMKAKIKLTETMN
jgi:hypothetical protein